MKFELEKSQKAMHRMPLPKMAEARPTPASALCVGVTLAPMGAPKKLNGETRKFRTETIRFSNGLAAHHLSRRNASAATELARGFDEIAAMLKTYKNAKESQLMGRIAEPHHASTFNSGWQIVDSSTLPSTCNSRLANCPSGGWRIAGENPLLW